MSNDETPCPKCGKPVYDKCEWCELRARNATLLAALKRVMPYATSYTDEGPPGEGWQTPEMQKALADAEAAIRRCERE